MEVKWDIEPKALDIALPPIVNLKALINVMYLHKC